MTKKEAAVIISIAAAAIPTLQDKDLAAAAASWAAILPDVSFVDGKAAMIKLLRERKIATLPLPGEILEAVKQFRPQSEKIPAPFEAWEEVRRNISSYSATKWSHPLITQTVRHIGSYDIIQGTWGVAERFVKVYTSLVEREKDKVENPIIMAIANSLDMNKGVLSLNSSAVQKIDTEETK